jgi:TP901 family phage tail tape measure protein
MADDIQSNIKINVDTASAMDSIRLLQNQISAFHTQMSRMGAATSADARNLQQNLINSINSTGAFTANMTKVRTTAEQFSLSLEKNKLSMGEYFRYAGGASKTFGKVFKAEFDTINKVARERVKDLQSQYIKLGRDANGAMQAIRVRPLVLDMDNLGTKTQIAAQRQQLLNQLLKQGSTNLLNFGKNTQWAGRQLMVGFTIPLSIMGAAAMKSYKEIEEAGIRLRRVYGDLGTTNMETEKMVKEIQRLALEYTKYGVAVKDSMQMAADAAAMGKKGADLLAQVSSSARLAVLGGVDQQMALKTTTSLTDAFGVSTRQLAKDINFLNAVENQTVLSIEDMTIAIPKAAPVIQQLGGDVKDLAFFLTAMKEGGINASESANALKSGLASLINPTNTASKMLQGFGINLREIVQGNRGDVKKTVVDFAQALDTLDPLNRARAIEQLFGKFQFARMSTLFKNVIEQGSQASQVLKLASASSLELSMLAQRELNKIEQSPLYKFQKSIADFQAALAPVGEQFMKALTPIINFGADVLKNFNNLEEGVKGFIVKVVAVAGVVGPVLLMSFGLIANAVANVIKGFALMKDIFNKTGKSSLSLGEQVNYMTNEQIQAAAIASSLDQVHSKLKQTFTSEAAAVDMLTAAYQRSVAAQRAFGVPITPRGPVATGPVKKYAAGGIIRGPGTGTSDSILAMVSNGEAIIPAKSVARNPGMVNQLVSGNIPGYRQGREGDIPTYGEYGLRLQNARENMRKQSSPASGSEILSFASMRIGEALGIKPSQSSVNKGLFDPIYKKYEQTFTRYADKIKLEFDTTFSDISDTNERMRQARQTAAKFIEKEAMQLSTSNAERLALRRSLGLEEDFYGSAPTMPRREGGRFLERARKSIYDLKTTGIRGYVSLSGGAKSLYSRMTGQSAENYQLGHYNEPRYVSGQELAKSPNLSGAARKALESVGITIGKQAEQSVVAGVKASTKQRSPSKEAHNAGANIGKGAIQGIQSQIDDAKNAGTQVGQAAAQGVSQSGRVAGRGSRRVRQEEMAPHSVTGQLVPLSMVNSPLYGPEEKPSAQKQTSATSGRRGRLSNMLSNAGNRVSSGISGMSQGKFQGGMFGASMVAGLGSMLGGPVGDVSGALSMPLAMAGMFPQIQGALGKIVGGLVRFVPFIGTALAAWQLWDQVAVPLIKKNADSYKALAETLDVTKEKIDGINSFFGTEGKITGIRAAVTGGLESQGSGKASIAAQFMESDNFKNNFQKSAQGLKDLSDKEVKLAMTALGADLTGMGYEKEAVQAIVEAMLMEAKKTKVSIDFESLTFGKNTVDSLSKDMSAIFKTYTENSPFTGIFNAEQVAKTEASVSQISSLISGLSGQFQNGIITGTEFSLNYDVIIRQFNALEKSQPGLGVQGMLDVLKKLNPEMAALASKITNLSSLSNITKAVSLGLNLPNQVYSNLEPTSSTLVQGEQNKKLNAAIRLAQRYGDQQVKNQKQIKNLQSSTADLSKVEQKINDKYDKRITQLDKIKKLNDQLTKSQQGQLSLAEALNKGDIGAAARAAIDIQNTDIQNALDQQKTGLDEAKNLELKGVSAQKDAIADSIGSLQASIETLQTKIESIEIKVVLPEAASTGVTSDVAPLRVTDPKTGMRVQTVSPTGPDGKPINAISDNQPWNKKPYTEWYKDPMDYTSRMASYFSRHRDAKPGKNGIYPSFKPYNIGGQVTGPGSGTSDSIPAMLSNGEYVIRANAVKTIGVDTLDKLNQADRIGFAAGGMVRKYKDGGKAKSWDLKDPSAPWNQGDFKKFNDYQTRKQYWAMSQPGSKEIVDAGKTAGYFMPGIGSGLAFGDAGTSFGKGDVGGGLLNTAFGFGAMWIPKALGMIGKGLGAAGDFIKTGLGIRGGKNALKAAASSTGVDVSKVGKLAPRLGFNLSDAALHSMVKDNFYGNMRTGVRSSTSDSLMNRIAVEKNMMGIPANAAASKTPAYGFLTTKEDVPSYYNSIMGGMGPRSKQQEQIDIFNRLINPQSRYLGRYGRNTIKLKPKALRRATVSMGDSLSIWDQAIRLGKKIPRVDKLSGLSSTFPALSGRLESTQKMMNTDVPGIRTPTAFPYIEAHLPGGFKLKDIESIMLNPTDKFGPHPEKIAADLAERKAALEALFKSMGIKGIKITENEGIKIGKNAFDDFINKGGKTHEGSMANYPLPSRGPKKPAGTPFSPISGPMQGASLPFGFSKAPTKAEMDAVVAFIQNSPLAQIQRGDALASIVGKSTIAKGNQMFRVPTIRQNEELATKNVGDIIDLGKRFTSIAGQSELQAIGMTAAGKLNTGNREIGVNTIIKFVAGEDIPGIMNHKVYNQNYLKSAFGKKADEYPFQSEGLLPPGLKGKIVGISQNGDQRILEVLLSKFAKGGMVRKYAMGGMVPIAEPAPRQFANGGYAMGTDTVPAMLTPGEFVIKKSAVDRIGTSTLNKINRYAEGGLVGGSTSTAIGDSVYNYSVNVNVATDSDPNQIARAVMSQIRKVDNHRVRGSGI